MLETDENHSLRFQREPKGNKMVGATKEQHNLESEQLRREGMQKANIWESEMTGLREEFKRLFNFREADMREAN